MRGVLLSQAGHANQACPQTTSKNTNKLTKQSASSPRRTPWKWRTWTDKTLETGS